MNWPRRVTVVEVGPRDGLQNEAASLTVDDRVAFSQALLDAGLRVVEVGSFVSPKWVPQMAGSDEVHRRLRRPAGARTPVLVPNRKGFDPRESRRADSRLHPGHVDLQPQEHNAHRGDLPPLRGSRGARGPECDSRHSTCFGCPYEGPVDPGRVVAVAERLAAIGCDEVSIGDTIGVAVPTQVADVVGRLARAIPLEQVAVHFHDTRGTALANVVAALLEGVAIVDSSAGGLGGCPYAPGASGNLATEDLLYMLHGMGIETGVDIGAVAAASRALAPSLGHGLPSRYLQATRAGSATPK